LKNNKAKTKPLTRLRLKSGKKRSEPRLLMALKPAKMY
jgi:hypothetical protein